MPDWQLWSLEPLFNHRRSTAWEMAKPTSFPSPISPHQCQRGGKHSGLSFSIGFSNVLKQSGQAAICLHGLQVEKSPKAPIKPVHIHKPLGTASLHFGKAILTSSLSKADFSSRQRSLEKSGLFHIMIWLLFFCWHFYWQAYQDQCQHDHLDFSFFQITCFWKKRMLINVSDILDKKID